MIRIHQLKLDIHHTENDLKAKILKTLHLSEDQLLSYKINKQSIDARKKPVLYYVYTVDVKAKKEQNLKKRIHNNNVKFMEEPKRYHVNPTGTEELSHRPVVIGTGPAGLFCGYQLAQFGYRPILLERGASVEERTRDVDLFWQTGVLNTRSNVQFGEGGAGTFSDGKLNTLVSDPFGRNQKVLELFVQYGASPKILYQQKPHVGTDVLSKVVKNMREAILRAGGEVRFHEQVTGVVLDETTDGRTLKFLEIYNSETGTNYRLEADVAVLAIGHSARDTFMMLKEQNIPMEAKAFAVGVRMEHPQTMINESQYGPGHDEDLPAAAYKLTAKTSSGRGVYTFCMCPGGYVVNASSEEGRLAVNGMSYQGRDGENANTAVIVTITPEDYGQDDVLDGIAFQRKLEEAAYRIGEGKIPVQLYGDFCRNQASKGPGEVRPQLKGACHWSNVREIFPEELAEALEEGIRQFDHKIHGYAREDAVVSGVESRTSSPIRILRDETFQSSVRGVYPCGEGAGYAGGITSAAMDGLKVAESVMNTFRPFDRTEEG